MTPIFDPLAKREYNDALAYHEAQQEGLGEELRRAVWAGIVVIERYPDIGEEVRPGIRKYILRRFPFKLIYSVDGETVHIIAGAHGRRGPEYWIDRD